MTGEMKADQRELRDDELDAVNGGTVMLRTHRYVYPVGVIFGAASLGPTFLPPSPC